MPSESSVEIKFTEEFQRDIYQVQSSTITILLTIYAKSEQEDISVQRIRQIVKNWLQDNEDKT